MKDGRTHLAHKAEHAVDLDTGAIVAVTLQGADEGDTTTIVETATAAADQTEDAQADVERPRRWKRSLRTRAITAIRRWWTSTGLWTSGADVARLQLTGAPSRAYVPKLGDAVLAAATSRTTDRPAKVDTEAVLSRRYRPGARTRRDDRPHWLALLRCGPRQIRCKATFTDSGIEITHALLRHVTASCEPMRAPARETGIRPTRVRGLHMTGCASKLSVLRRFLRPNCRSSRVSDVRPDVRDDPLRLHGSTTNGHLGRRPREISTLTSERPAIPAILEQGCVAEIKVRLPGIPRLAN